MRINLILLEGLQALRHSPTTGLATGKTGSKQKWCPIQKHAGRSSIDRKTASHLSDPQCLLKCGALSCEGVVKTVQTSLQRNKQLRQVRDFSPSMLLYGTLPLFRTNSPRCHALPRFVTSSLASLVVSSTNSEVLTGTHCLCMVRGRGGGGGGIMSVSNACSPKTSQPSYFCMQ